jgi:ubiquinone/menaquinone biosynthesis C-methylase UbiE
MLLIKVYRTPLQSPITRPPKRVLEIGCGAGIWSLLCHRYFRELGYRSVSFTGIDIAPTESGVMVPDADMDWVFVQHDLINTLPWPFPDDHFDLVFHKEMTLAVPVPQYPPFSEEIFRVLKPGGILEVWEVDHIIRLLRPHTPRASSESKAVMKLGAYVLDITTPLSAPLNPFLVEYNHWLSQALGTRMIMPNPCRTAPTR